MRRFLAGFQGLAVLLLVSLGLADEPCARVEPGGPGDCNANGEPDDCDIGPHALGFAWRSVHGFIRGNNNWPGITTIDIDGDGDDDFVLHKKLEFLAFLNRGDGTFEEPVVSPGHQDSVHPVAGVDVQGDGIPDLITENDFVFTSVEGVHFGRGDGTFGPFEEFHAPDPHSFLLPGDVDGDGGLDLVVGEYMVPAVTVLFGDRDSIFGEFLRSPTQSSAYDGELADLDDDGDLDLVLILGDAPQRGIAIWANDGTGRFAASDGLSYARPEANEVSVADLDGDGRQDIVFTAGSESGLEVLVATRAPGEPARFSPPEVVVRTQFLLGPLVLDFDGDGDQDLALHDPGRLFIFENRTRIVAGAPAFDFAPPGESIGSFREISYHGPRVLKAGVGGVDALVAPVRVVECVDPITGEIALLTSRREPRDQDCDHNGVPDECDTDCNRDDIPDACQSVPPIRCLTVGGECPLDCNQNGVGDPCDIAEGASQDGDGDGIPDECQADEAAYAFQGPLSLRGKPGTEATADFACVLIPGRELLGVEPGVYSYSVSLRAEGLEVTGVTVSGTPAADRCEEPGGLRENGYLIARLAVDPGVSGAVAAVVLSMQQPVWLPLDRPHTILRFSVRAELPTEPGVRAARLLYQDGLRHSGHPGGLRNVFYYTGGGTGTATPALFDLPVEISSLEYRFRRGDANVDGEFNISDGLHTLQNLFLGGPRGSCREAADVNDSGAVDISDAIGTFQNLFLGGPRPPPPGPFECGPDPTPDNLGCFAFPGCPVLDEP